MNTFPPRRDFLRSIALTSAWAGIGPWSLFKSLPSVSAAEAAVDPKMVRLRPEIEPLVRLLEETPRSRLLEEIGTRVRHGLSYREVLTALLLAGVRNIQPRPVGFKFHAVLVVNSAHLASLSSPDADRWLPIFWALNQFKISQEQDSQQGNWTMGAIDEKSMPPSHLAEGAFRKAMDNWDEAAADVAVASLARSSGASQWLDLFCYYGARDFRSIGHKAIFVANSWRTLECIGWQHAEPVLRSLAYALLARDEQNPATHDLPPDRPGRRNLEWARQLRPNDAAIESWSPAELLQVLREGSEEDAAKAACDAAAKGVPAPAIWDAMHEGAGELMMRAPGIVSLHAVTTTNALHHLWQMAANPQVRWFLLLQNASFLPLFRGKPSAKGERIDTFEPEPLKQTGPEALEEIFAEISRDRMRAARKTLAYLDGTGSATEFMQQARRLIFLKGRDSHDYKFSSAALEDYFLVSPQWRNRFLASSVFRLRGSGEEDNDLVQRIRAAVG
jgi:hypothetical protein